MFRKQSYILLMALFFLNSCGDTWTSVKRGLTGQKQKSTEEFLVRKKDPLILPPNYESLPTPGERSDAKKEQSALKKLILDEDNNLQDSSSSGSSLEDNILKKIKKN
jgi:hypothetical protein